MFNDRFASCFIQRRIDIIAGTKAGGKKVAATNKRKYGDNYYARIGAIGGKLGRTGGFYANRELASEAGRKGGLNSKRPKKEAVNA